MFRLIYNQQHEIIKTYKDISVVEKSLIVKMNNCETWSVPVSLIAKNRAEYYSDEFSDVKKSLEEDTIPLFEYDSFEIEDWVKNNMDWVDVKDEVKLVNSSFNYQEGWVESEVDVL